MGCPLSRDPREGEAAWPISLTHPLCCAPALMVWVSQMLAYPIKVQPLGVFGQAIDGGQKINNELWHPYREPVFHSPASVKDVVGKLPAAWEVSGLGHEEYLISG